ncbi:RRS1-domain-containing protein [Schizopora paradoxa]|uniref:Ribosome biogenesis regulatory protein n=1 Tax=Schizopora paradoxa TaxID=27342 RepID=A0A0H2S7L9_9AGAM|nr:RRS1-domain-containing protein [Schizopora paradoxa]
MDVSGILQEQAEKRNVTSSKQNLEIDVGCLAVTDSNPVDENDYSANLEDYLQSTAREGVQALITSLLSLPKQQTPDGPLSLLPAPTTQLPRQKPLPKPKPPTKWEKFAAAKGIQKTRREKKVWDEEKQDWVDRWGWKGKNKEKEEQWLSEVPANADVDHNPSQVARAERKKLIAKNERQRKGNEARAQANTSEQDKRKNEIEKTLASTRISTASMGKFDKKLEGEKKLRGIKRKFDPTERSVESEKKSALALISKIDGQPKKAKISPEGGTGDALNVRKAVRFASKGKGGVALAQGQTGKRQKGSKRSK